MLNILAWEQWNTARRVKYLCNTPRATSQVRVRNAVHKRECSECLDRALICGCSSSLQLTVLYRAQIRGSASTCKSGCTNFCGLPTAVKIASAARYPLDR